MRARLAGLLRSVSFWLFVPGMAIVIWGELAPGTGIPDIWDKVQHFIAYGGLAGMAMLAFGNRRRALAIALGLIAMGGLLEVVQGLTGRDASFWDEIANTAGVICGVISALWLSQSSGET